VSDSERSSAVSNSESEQVEAPPLLRVVNPDATPEEIAALVAVFAALGSASAVEPPRRRTPEWSAHHRKVRTTHPHGPGGWRSSGSPR
jgi:hypothetical protein